MEQQIRIPCCLMRGGTSKGPFFNQADLPADIKQRNKVLLAAMGSPDKRQIDGLGGAHPLTSKVGIVAKCEANTQGAELSFYLHSYSLITLPLTLNLTAAICWQQLCLMR